MEPFMLRTLAVIFGLVFLAIGILGFVPAFTPDGMLLGIFQVNLVHNLVHLLTGVVSLLCGLSSVIASRWFFRLFGIVYGVVAVWGFVVGDAPILGILANNKADAWLHTGIAIVSLALGFGCCSYCRPEDYNRSENPDRPDSNGRPENRDRPEDRR